MAVPISRWSYRSTSADDAWDALSKMYTRARPHSASPDASISFDTVAVPGVFVDRGWLHTAQGAFDASPDQVNIILVCSGRISLDFGRRGAVANTAGDSYLYLPDGAADLQWEDFGALALRVPLRLVALSAAELTGIDPGAVRFLSARPITPAHARLWQQTVEKLWRELSAPDGVVGRLVHHELVNHVTAAAVSVFPNTAMTRGYVPGPGAVQAPAVRRALAYIDAHLSLPVSVADIAAAAGTTPRALRAAFRRHLDTTPTAYLRRARLSAAHHDLRTLDPQQVTSTEVAARWGFSSVAAFATAYQRAYGVAPHTDTDH